MWDELATFLANDGPLGGSFPEADDELWDWVNDAWSLTAMSKLNSFIDSMPERIRRVI